MDKYYITTTLPYVNAEPHIGFALEIVQADCLARYQRALGREVIFNFGTDEHGLKIYRRACEEGKDPQKYVDEYAKQFDKLKKLLKLSYDRFLRTSSSHHKKAAVEFWKRCEKNGDIYKKEYKTKYCVGCELEKTDSELEDGKCPLHPKGKLEIIEEENYFFRFSKYQKALLDMYERQKDFIVPSFRQKEIKKFVEGGLRDFSISRLKEKLPWGVEVPGDSKHVMYVWFDALINYVSTLGWPEEDISGWWPGVQVAGKDNLRQQSAIWQAMLISAGLKNTKQIFIHGFVSLNGQKISKSLGNTISPFDLVSKYGADAVRYYLLGKIHSYEDGDFTIEKFEEAYNSDLANGLGNLVSRVCAMGESEGLMIEERGEIKISSQVSKYLERYRFDLALGEIWKKIGKIDALINQREVWALESDKKKESLSEFAIELRQAGKDLEPFLPDTSKRISEIFSKGKLTKGKPLFPRIN
jgi:methionyl-tRNA synthetase